MQEREMTLLTAFLMISVLFIIFSLISMGGAWCLRIRRRSQLLLVSVSSGLIFGIIVTVISGMMSSSRFPGVALFIGALMGMTFGLITGGLYLSISQAFKTKDKTKNIHEKVKK